MKHQIICGSCTAFLNRFHGGWVCPNIYYLGTGGIVNFGGLRIAGLSGIYNSHNYMRGFDEKQPLTGSDIRSIYHLRRMSVYKMEQVKRPIDVFISHDWPRDIVAHGNKNKLLQVKKFLKKEIEDKTLGSPPLEILLKKLKPSYWFSAHMHVKFNANVIHHQFTSNPDEINIEDSDDSDKETSRKRPKIEPQTQSTKFLSLDKCLPRREFLEVLKVNRLWKSNVKANLIF
jgi:lariat debranching enzyme